MNVLVLSGGNSPEREVSIRSGKAVSRALKLAGYNVFEYDPALGFEGLREFYGRVDCVLPILHGRGGEDGTVQAELERQGFKYLGAGPESSKNCFNKDLFKNILSKQNISVPAGEIVDRNGFLNSNLIKKPYVLKPNDGGSTIDTFIIRDVAKAVDISIFDKYPTMLLEELIIGKEVTVPVLGTKALPVIEIIPPQGREFDYENKYNGATQELCPPIDISTTDQQESQRLAELAHGLLGVKHLSRTDIIIDSQGRQWVLELNTMPGMTEQSLFPKAASVAGITMTELVQRFMKMATG